MLIALDTETGGLKADINPILSLALYNDDIQFYCQIKGDRAWCDKKALEINGLDPDVGLTKGEAQTALIEFWEKNGKPKFEVIGHNVGAFDIPFVQQIAPPAKMFDYHYRDTLVAMALLKDSGLVTPGRLNLGSCCEYFGITFDAHNALEDAKAAWKLWHRCLEVINNKA
jgi:DNA polymerase-3 subunit epsilon/ribonuclease T